MALGNVVARLLVRLGLDKKEFDSGAQDAKSQARGLATSLNEVRGSSDLLTGALKGVGVLGMAYMAREAAGAIYEIGKLGAESLRLSNSFDELAGRIGETGDSLLDSLRDTSRGTVSDMDLMRTTAGLLASGIDTSTQDITDAMEIARLKAQQFGLSTTEAYDRMLTGARKFSVEMLDELGINIKAESAYKRRAAALGISVSAMNDAQRASALWQAILEDGRRELAEYGPASDDFVDSIDRASAAIDNAKAALGEGFAPLVADFADAIAEIVPAAMESAQGLGILTEAAWSWLQALIAGRDAQAAFDLTVAESVGNLEQLAQAQLNVAAAELEAARAAREEADAAVTAELARENFSAVEYEAATAAQKAAMERVSAALLAYNATKREVEAATAAADAEREAAAAAEEAAAASNELGEALTRLPPGAYATMNAMQEMAGQMLESASAAFALRDAMADLNDVSADEIGNQFSTAAGRIERGLSSLAGDQPITLLRALRNQYVAELTELYTSANDLTEFELAYREQLIMNAFDDEVATLRSSKDAQADVLSDMADNYQSLRGTIESALSATTVTPLDMGLSELGEYVDNWDENARRLDAIAQRGFAELEAHPDWASLLAIPENVLAAGEDALKSWASQTASDVRNLFRPDLLNVEAAADAVEAYMQEQAARELSIDLVIGELQARGGITADEAASQVRQAYGLETEPVDIPINLVSSIAGDEGAGWTAAADELVGGIREGFSDSSLVTEFVGYFRKDIANNEGLLSGAGEALWDTVELGILVRLDRADYAGLFVSKLGPLVGAWILENQTNTQGEGTP